MTFRFLTALFVCLLAGAVLVSAQIFDQFAIARAHPAIAYTTRQPRDPVAKLIAEVERGDVQLAYDAQSGYLTSVLAALKIEPDSQLLVFSKTSFQAPKIGPANPRALYFNDNVSVGYVRGGDYLEFAAQDPEQGTMFYTLKRGASGVPEFARNNTCLSCHVSESTMNVPGMFAGSIYPTPTGLTMYAPVYYTDHRSRLEQRWGGWYVTGRHGSARHMGNGVVAEGAELVSISADANQNVVSLEGRITPAGYLSLNSDIVALMVLEHQMHLSNLLTRAAWEVRIDSPDGRRMLERNRGVAVDEGRQEQMIEATRPAPDAVKQLKGRPLREVAVEIVDYMLFVDEAPFEGRIEGVSGFAKRFSAQGPHDSKGRSFRQLDLERRLLKYPCSYMIYSEQFEALPAIVRHAIYERLWVVLNGGDKDPIYQKLSPADRQAILEILRDTKTDLPAQFRG
jgi:hypothetical protein